jgi:two-component system, chemotaxis family, protein-glutamate methylesterase/glutaminase
MCWGTEGMPKIRVMVVDDAVVVRRLLSEELAKDPAIEVVGSASNGRIALARIPQINPDLVILDVEMPEMDGLTALAEIRKTYPRMPVVMFSALTERGAKATLDALALGASDYFTKPTSEAGVEASLQIVRDELIPTIKALVRKEPARTAPAFAIPQRPASVASAGAIQIVAIGCSTGGPNALAEVLPQLPANLPVPIVIVQHMPPMFTRLLAERLTAQSALKVHEATSGAVLEPGHAYVAPGDCHMTVVRDGTRVRVRTNQDPPENSCRPAVDVLLRSLAATYGPNSLTVILTGMGQDGLRGCETVREAGGQIIAQDEATSVVWGMPGFVVKAGLAAHVLPLDQIGMKIQQLVVRPTASAKASAR